MFRHFHTLLTSTRLACILCLKHVAKLASHRESLQSDEITSSGQALRTHRCSTGFYGPLRVFYRFSTGWEKPRFSENPGFYGYPRVRHGLPWVFYGFAVHCLKNAVVPLKWCPNIIMGTSKTQWFGMIRNMSFGQRTFMNISSQGLFH